MGFLVVVYLAAGLRRVFVAQKPTWRLGRPFGDYLVRDGSLNDMHGKMFLTATMDDDPELILDESSKPLFPPLSPKPRSDMDRAFGFSADPDPPGERRSSGDSSDRNMFTAFLDSLKSLFSPKEWKSTGLKQSKIVKGKVDSKHGMEPFKKPGRASDWMKKGKN